MCACSTLRGLARHVTAIYDDCLKPTRLKQTQFMVLARLDGLVQCSLAELAKVCDLDVTSLSRALSPFKTAGIIRVGAGKDARTKRIELTPHGKRLIQRAFPLWQQAQKVIHQVIPPEQVRALRRLSTALHER